MEALGNGEVIAVIIAGGYPQQVLLGVAFAGSLCAHCLGAAQRQVAYGT
jgi:hypothetical protein